ncbi:hypothetical protein BSK66_09080 [Paenibacillus odorifer]|uniref:Alkyl hydroperoxide reductase subunit C/ Thiol specific antioxidant domain-containing protein n=1 Tax=Paenibacillus odorifer TaxID=189426 RepID=A0A1R0XER2_9BACL|nr:hypothetical protein BJP47_19350 [Paenibacillus odorifer]OMD33573.1 hypothetical protein BJP51_11685 [Paenibacillus odorifer]OME25430.1 hypothetical protein BSK57_12205 [Paenibacillus odorifer]OME31199.1 hypothetical protein BSK63_15845 [Paenibacillus odorifer]OME36095.1 hypothetical protein BSK46_18005 [Paenibacillus odorifer]
MYQSLIFFISVDCARCIELLPFISLISQNYNDYHLYIFSTGDEEINKEIRDYFEWKFPVITLSSKEMDDVYKVKIHPFVIISNNTGKVVNKGVVYNSNDMMMLINEGR